MFFSYCIVTLTSAIVELEGVYDDDFSLMLYMVPQATSSWWILQAKEHSVYIFLSLSFSYFLMLLLLLLRKKLPILGAVLHTKRKKRRKKKRITAVDINGVLFLFRGMRYVSVCLILNIYIFSNGENADASRP